MKLRIIPFILLSLILFSCHKLKTPEAAIERENWIAGFSDSIEYYQNHSAEAQKNLAELNSRIKEMLGNFDYVKKPREVSGYYILKGWGDKVPLKSTGIYTRINENEKLELIATLSGATFNQISVGEGENTFYSEVVPNDQAFNFRHQGYNTVYFSGGKADTIAQYIASSADKNIILNFLEGGTLRKKFTLPGNEEEMISKTWSLFEIKKEEANLQKEIWIDARKIDAFRRIMEAEENKKFQSQQ